MCRFKDSSWTLSKIISILKHRESTTEFITSWTLSKIISILKLIKFDNSWFVSWTLSKIISILKPINIITLFLHVVYKRLNNTVKY